MKMKCKVCGTVYDNKEKYCPYCFNRTNRHDCYNLNSEVVYSKNKYRQPDKKIYEGKAIQNQRARQNSFNYQQRTASKYKKNKTNPVTALATGLFIVFGMIFFSLFVMIFMNIIFFF